MPLYPYLDKSLKLQSANIRTQYEDDKYRELESTKWRDGYEGLSGIHYFYLTQGTLISGKSGKIKPEYRDSDMFFLDAYLECLKEDKNMLELKWRGWGFSSMIGLIIVYNAIRYKGCEQIVTAPDNGRIALLKTKKIIPFLRGLQSEGWVPSQIYDSKPDEMELTDDRKNEVEFSTIIYKETASDLKAVQNLEGRRARTIALDEWFNHERSKEVLLSAEGSTTEQGEKFGTILAGGSCNNVNAEGVKRLNEMIASAEARGFKIHITPAYMSRRGFTTDGVSDVLKATEYVHKQLAEYKNAGDYEKYWQFKKENFLSISDIISSSVGEDLSDDMHDKIARGRRIAYELNIQPCKLRWHPEGIFTDKDEHGHIWIAEMPKKGHVYIGGCDPIPGTSDKAAGSDFALAIKDITENKYVAYYAERTNDKQKMYAEFKLLLALYKSHTFPNGACCMIERNHMAFIDAISIERGEGFLLASDPKSKDPRVKGYHKPPNSHMDDKLNALIFTYLNSHDIPFIRFYDELDIMMTKNADLMDAVKSCEYYQSFFTRTPDSSEDLTRKHMRIEVGADGNTQQVWD